MTTLRPRGPGEVLVDGAVYFAIMAALWLLSQLAGCYKVYAADVLADESGGQVLAAGSGDPHAVARFQPLARLRWQWVPPETRCINGQRLMIPGHWHDRFAKCPTCGDRTKTTPTTSWPPPASYGPGQPQPTAPIVDDLPAGLPAATPTSTPADPDAWRAGFSQLEQRIVQIDAERKKDLAALDKTLAELLGNQATAIDGLAGVVATLQTKIEANGQAPPPLRPIPTAPDPGPRPPQHAPADPAADSDDAAGGVSTTAATIGNWMTDPAVIGLIGTAAAAVGIPSWAIYAGAYWWRNRRRKQATQTGRPSAPDRPQRPPTPVVIDTPPPPQLKTTDVHFVPYETSILPRAHAFAKEHTGRKYPGQIPILEAYESLVKQFIDGQRPTT